MTELFKFKSKEQALSEIDKRLMEAMRPTQNTGRLLSKMKEFAGARKAGGATTPIAQ